MFKKIGRFFKRIFKKPSAPQMPNTPDNKSPVDVASFKRGTLPCYKYMWDRMQILPQYKDELEDAYKIIKKGQYRYEAVSQLTGVPWYVIAVIHWRECHCDFKGVLHNGERIVGTNKKTSIVPKGRGPFSTWEQSAIDALRSDRFTGVTDWSIENTLRLIEGFNGWGYLNENRNTSPYVWSYTNQCSETGKFVRDHVYDANAPAHKYAGCAALIKTLELKGEVTLTRHPVDVSRLT